MQQNDENDEVFQFSVLSFSEGGLRFQFFFFLVGLFFLLYVICEYWLFFFNSICIVEEWDILVIAYLLLFKLIS